MLKELKLRFVYLLADLCEKTPLLRDVSQINSGLKIVSNWSPWATKNRPGRIEIMTWEPIVFFFFFFLFFIFLGLPLQVLLFE